MHPRNALLVMLPLTLAFALAGCTGVKLVPLTNETTLEPGSLVSAGEYTITLVTVGEVSPGVKGATFAASSGTQVATKTIAEGKRAVLFGGDLAITVKSVGISSATISVEAGLRAAGESRGETTPIIGKVHGNQSTIVDAGQEAACGPYKVKVISIDSAGAADILIYHESGRSQVVRLDLGTWTRAFDGDIVVGVKKSSQFEDITYRRRVESSSSRSLSAAVSAGGGAEETTVGGEASIGGETTIKGTEPVAGPVANIAESRIGPVASVPEGRIILGVRCGVKEEEDLQKYEIPPTKLLVGYKVLRGQTVYLALEGASITYLQFSGSAVSPVIVLKLEAKEGSEAKKLLLGSTETFMKNWLVTLKEANQEVAVVTVSRFYYEEPDVTKPEEPVPAQPTWIESKYYSSPFEGIGYYSLKLGESKSCGRFKVRLGDLIRIVAGEPTIYISADSEDGSQYTTRIGAGGHATFSGGDLQIFVNGIKFLNEKEGKAALTISCKYTLPETEFCSTVYQPVCGYNRNTYGNDCEARRAGAEVAYAGACGTVGCTAEYAPVCGTDGNTYSNECVAKTSYAHVAHRGECTTSQPQQPLQHSPILVGNGNGTFTFLDGDYTFCGGYTITAKDVYALAENSPLAVMPQAVFSAHHANGSTEEHTFVGTGTKFFFNDDLYLRVGRIFKDPNNYDAAEVTLYCGANQPVYSTNETQGNQTNLAS
ncbi:hypothetical protein HY546_02085 [archaeon]|nr:hypothetical protein [archaeon]